MILIIIFTKNYTILLYLLILRKTIFFNYMTNSLIYDAQTCQKRHMSNSEQDSQK